MKRIVNGVTYNTETSPRREVALLPSVVIGLPLCREARDDGR